MRHVHRDASHWCRLIFSAVPPAYHEDRLYLQKAQSRAERIVNAMKHKILIAYFSHTGYTATLAKEIADLTGGSLFQIQPVDDYPEDYRATVDRYKEETTKHLRPAVTGSVRDMDQYDVLFVGFPNWGGDLPYIVYSFLEQYDLAGKRIVPFCTNGGGGIGQSFILLQDACRTARVMKGFACNGRQAVDQTDALREWLSGLGLLKE